MELLRHGFFQEAARRFDDLAPELRRTIGVQVALSRLARRVAEAWSQEMLLRGLDAESGTGTTLEQEEQEWQRLADVHLAHARLLFQTQGWEALRDEDLSVLWNGWATLLSEERTPLEPSDGLVSEAELLRTILESSSASAQGHILSLSDATARAYLSEEVWADLAILWSDPGDSTPLHGWFRPLPPNDDAPEPHAWRISGTLGGAPLDICIAILEAGEDIKIWFHDPSGRLDIDMWISSEQADNPIANRKAASLTGKTTMEEVIDAKSCVQRTPSLPLSDRESDTEMPDDDEWQDILRAFRQEARNDIDSGGDDEPYTLIQIEQLAEIANKEQGVLPRPPEAPRPSHSCMRYNITGKLGNTDLDGTVVVGDARGSQAKPKQDVMLQETIVSDNETRWDGTILGRGLTLSTKRRDGRLLCETVPAPKRLPKIKKQPGTRFTVCGAPMHQLEPMIPAIQIFLELVKASPQLLQPDATL